MNDKWNLRLVLNDEKLTTLAADKQKALNASQTFRNKWLARSDYLSESKVLFEALSDYEQWETNNGASGDQGYYFSLKQSLDQSKPEVKAKVNQIDDWSTKIGNEMEFFFNRLAKVDKEKQQLFLKEEKLKKYHHFLERLWVAAPHILSEAEEKILAIKGTTSYGKWVDMVSEFIAQEKIGGKNLEQLFAHINGGNKKQRDKAVQAVNKILAKHSQTAEHELNAILTDKKNNDELRHYEHPEDARLMSDDISLATVEAMLTAVTNHFGLSARFYQLKAKLLGQEKLAYHERNVIYGKINKKYSFDQGVTLTEKVLGKLDDEFLSIYQRFLNNSQIDVYPKDGKQGGAFCAEGRISQPTYILLNWTDKVTDVLTMAHEVGHGINNELMRQTQTALNFGSPLSTAEVASTFMEDFVLEELTHEADDELKLSLLMAKINDDVSSIFRQVACFKFEREIHQQLRAKGYLDRKEIGVIFQKQMKEYMGKAVEQDPGSENWWVYWSHIRRFFYVYSYASGLLISKAMQRMVRQDHQNINKVKTFLRAGSSRSPKDIFGAMGIMIEEPAFWEEGLREIETTLEETEQLARKLNKI